MAATDESNHETESVDNHWNHWHHHKPHVILVAILIVVVIFGIGLLAGHASERFRAVRFNSSTQTAPGVVVRRFGGAGFGGGGSSANQNRLQGVVTSVNGSTLTIAGDGATNTVVTNGSTQYNGGSQPKVNDTIIAVGSIDNSTFTATQITINP